jgi:hypothetical protein
MVPLTPWMCGHARMVYHGVVHIVGNEALTVTVPNAAAIVVHCA